MSARHNPPTLNYVLEQALLLAPVDRARLAHRLIEQIIPSLEQLPSRPWQLPLFDEPAQTPPPALVETPAGPVESPATSSSPCWTFAPGYDNTDLIADEPATLYLFSIDALSAQEGFYSNPVFRQLLRALRDLGQDERRQYREQAFTLFAGDLFDAAVAGVEGEIFGLAVDSAAATAIEPLRRAMTQVAGFCGVDMGAALQLIPKFRYDHGYVVEYCEEELAGTSYTDDADNFGSGLTIFRRTWLPTEEIGRRRSHYGKLRRK